MRSFSVVLICLLFMALAYFAFALPAQARSAYSPRHSGLEPPGGPRPLEALPGNGAGNSLDGGMRRKDAYGNEIAPYEEREKTPRRRLRQGAYGGRGEPRQMEKLPDPVGGGTPVWKFQ